MKLLLNINQYDYQLFLDSKVDILIIGLKNFSSGYLKNYDITDLESIIKNIHQNKKQIYLSINTLLNEDKINDLASIFSSLLSFDIDGFVINDWGALQLFKEHDLINKVIFNPVTTITNKYSANIANSLGMNHVVLANELNISDILEVASYTKGNIEILGQGYYQICDSKRPLLSNYFKKFKIVNDSLYYTLKEENRDYAYPIIELNGETLIYIDKERSTLPYLEKLKKAKIKYLRIDTMFLSKDEVDLHVAVYSKAISNSKNIATSLKAIENTNSNFKCLDNISILKKGEQNG